MVRSLISHSLQGVRGCGARSWSGAWLVVALLTSEGQAAEQRVVRVAFDAIVRPVAFLDEEGRPAGFAADYVRAIAREADFEPEFVTGARDKLWAEFAAGQVDVVASLVFTEERAKTMDFALPYLVLDGAVFARRDGVRVRSLADLEGRRVAVSRGNVTHDYVRAHPEWKIEIVPVDSTEAALRLVQEGGCEAAINIALVAEKMIRERGLDRVVRQEVALPGLVYKYHMAVKRGDAALLRRINEAQWVLRERGEFERLHEKWIGPLKVRELEVRELRPYLWPGVAVLAVVVAVFVWQRRNLVRFERQAEALRRSEERYSVVVEQTGQMIYDLDVASGVNRWFGAAAVEKITGYTLEEFQAVTLRGWSEMIHAEDRAVAFAEFDRCCAAGLRYDAIYRFQRKDLSYRTIQDFGVFLRDEQGKVVRMLGAMADVTERREAEEAIRQLNAELEQRVAERTAELARRVAEVERLNAEQHDLMRNLKTSEQAADRSAARLQEANSNLLTANQELEAFSYSVSHDLRAPLRNITGFLELLERRSAGRLDAEETRYVQTVTREAARLGTLIDELLTFSRMGRAEMRLQRVPLAELVAEVRHELQSVVGGRTVEWRIGELPAVEGDRALLRLVLANLLGNAVKFTRRCEVAIIEVGVLGAVEEEGRVTIFVRDNGAGFNPKYGEKLFGVFQRLHNQRDFEGTGIGLANVKRIVTRHGGRVWAEGKVDKGAVFYFNLRTLLS